MCISGHLCAVGALLRQNSVPPYTDFPSSAIPVTRTDYEPGRLRTMRQQPLFAKTFLPDSLQRDCGTRLKDVKDFRVRAQGLRC